MGLLSIYVLSTSPMIENSAAMTEDQSTTLLTTPATVSAPRKPRKKELKNLTRRDGIWYFHKLVNGKRFFLGRKTPFSLDTPDLAVAKTKRDALLRSANGVEVDRVLGRESRKVASLAEIFAAYEAADHSREDVRKRNVRVLKRILARAGRPSSMESLTTADLEGVVEDFQDDVVRVVRDAGHDDDSEDMLRAKFSADSMLTQARAVFAREKPFRKLHFAKPVKFLEADRFSVKRDLAYLPMSPAEVALFAAESEKIRSAREAVYLMWLCMRWLG